MTPIKMTPVYKSYLWGGDHLRSVFGKVTPEPPVAESWEVASHAAGMSVAANGECAGMTIPEITKKYGKDFLGDTITEEEVFPLLLKILDANDRLSVQVHPEDAYANEHENGEKGKTEAWYILHAEEGASLIYGFRPDVTKESFRKAIEEGTLEEILNKVPCKAGDVFFIPAGTVHAVGAGLLIAEIQQNSNTTYRVFDYNRVGADGKLRELHVEKALAVSDVSSAVGKEKTEALVVEDGANKREYVLCNPYFAFEKLICTGEMADDTENKLMILFIAEGEGEVDGVPFKRGDSLLIPAETGIYQLKGNCEVLKFYVPAETDYAKFA